MKPKARMLIHEVWEDLQEGQRLQGICLAGPRGEDFRASQSKDARLIARIEAASHFEAMTEYHKLLGREPYSTNHDWDRQAYPTEWFDEQASAR